MNELLATPELETNLELPVYEPPRIQVMSEREILNTFQGTQSMQRTNADSLVAFGRRHDARMRFLFVIVDESPRLSLSFMGRHFRPLPAANAQPCVVEQCFARGARGGHRLRRRCAV